MLIPHMGTSVTWVCTSVWVGVQLNLIGLGSLVDLVVVSFWVIISPLSTWLVLGEVSKVREV